MTNDNTAVQYAVREYAIGSPANRHVFESPSYAATLIGKTGIYASLYYHSDEIEKHAEAQFILKGKVDLTGYKKSVAAHSLTIDLDSKDDVELARQATIRVVARLKEQYHVDDRALSICFSGKKGFHIEIPAELFGGFSPSTDLPKLHKLIAVHLTEGFGPLLDTSIYRHTGLIRLENTIHQDTGLYSMPITFQELQDKSMGEIRAMAVQARTDLGRLDPKLLQTSVALAALKEIQPEVLPLAVSSTSVSSKIATVEPPPIAKWSNIAKHCKIISDIERKSKTGENIVHDERVQLGTIATAFGTDGKRKVHELLLGQGNYNQEKTESYMNQMLEHGYKPAVCDSICGPDNLCPAIKILRRRSPIAFAYTNGDKDYVESYAVERLIKHFSDLIYVTTEKLFYEYYGGVYRVLDEEQLKVDIRELLPFYFPLKDITNHKLNELIKRLKLERPIRFDGRMNSDMYRINLNNGIYDLRTGELSQHSPEFKSSVQLPFSYDPKAACPRFDQFMLDTFKGDQEIIDYILKLWCYLFMPTYAFQKIWVWIGEGRNGKGVLSRLMIRTLGLTNVSHEDIHQLAHERFSTVNLKDKLANFSTELRTDYLDLTAMKKLSGEDFISAEFKGKDKFSFKSFARLIVSGNQLPRISEIGTAFSGRFVFIPFRNVVLDGAVDTKLEERLATELPGIFNRVVSMFQQIQSPDGTIYFPETKTISEARTSALTSLNSAVEFIESECRKVPGQNVLLKDLFGAYQIWCKNSGYKEMGRNRFADALRCGCKLSVTNGAGNQLTVYGVMRVQFA
jgi:putative DNA primase/helicase